MSQIVKSLKTQTVEALKLESHSKILSKNHSQICRELGREMIFTLISALNHFYDLT